MESSPVVTIEPLLVTATVPPGPPPAVPLPPIASDTLTEVCAGSALACVLADHFLRHRGQVGG